MTPNPTTHIHPPPPIYLKIWASLCSQIAYRDRLKDIRATLEISPFFKCHEVGVRRLSSGAETCAVWWAMTLGRACLSGGPAPHASRPAPEARGSSLG